MKTLSELKADEQALVEALATLKDEAPGFADPSKVIAKRHPMRSRFEADLAELRERITVQSALEELVEIFDFEPINNDDELMQMRIVRHAPKVIAYLKQKQEATDDPQT